MRGVSVARRLVYNTTNKQLPIAATSFSSFTGRTLGLPISSPSKIPQSAPSNNDTTPSSWLMNSAAPFRSFHLFNRNFSSASGPSNIVLVESEEQLNSSLRKAQDESLPAIFYFTAAWCPPCKLISPVIGQLSEKYPHVTTYKIDIDQKELGVALNRLDINSVPTFHFFQNGRKASEMIGADVLHLKDTMAKLYE